jgi:hypothetical protein
MLSPKVRKARKSEKIKIVHSMNVSEQRVLYLVKFNVTIC